MCEDEKEMNVTVSTKKKKDQNKKKKKDFFFLKWLHLNREGTIKLQGSKKIYFMFHSIAL